MRLLPAALLFLAGGVIACAQNPAQPQLERDTKSRIVLDVTRVDILATVTDKRGRFINELGSSDFEVIEDGRPQKVIGLSTRSELPLRLAILIDASSSMRDRFRFVQEAAIDFATKVMRPSVDKAAVMSFDAGVAHASPMIGETDVLARAIRELRPGGGTSLYDAIYAACTDRLPAEQPLQEFRRAMIVLTDGEDTISHYTRDQALEAAHRSGVVIFAISTNTERLDTHGDKVLKYFTSETGGLAFFPFKLEDLGKSFQQLANQLRNQYSIYYKPDPPKTDGKFHTIGVSVRGGKKYIVRARTGYYAPKQ